MLFSQVDIDPHLFLFSEWFYPQCILDFARCSVCIYCLYIFRTLCSHFLLAPIWFLSCAKPMTLLAGPPLGPWTKPASIVFFGNPALSICHYDRSLFFFGGFVFFTTVIMYHKNKSILSLLPRKLHPAIMFSSPQKFFLIFYFFLFKITYSCHTHISKG